MGCSDGPVSEESHPDKIKLKTLFISDTHLGTLGCQAGEILEFLNEHQFEKIYLVGDFIDIWQLSKKRFWNQLHTDVIRKILKKSKRIPVVFITGNHDEFCENFIGQFGNITICDRADYYNDGKKYLVIHGHQFDYVTKHSKFLAYFGSIAYNWMVKLNFMINHVRHVLGFSNKWSLSSYVKKNVKNAVAFIFNFEKALITYAKQEGYDGVICGHIHSADMKETDGIEYLNTGDWVESCTALIEDMNGNLSIYRHSK